MFAHGRALFERDLSVRIRLEFFPPQVTWHCGLLQGARPVSRAALFWLAKAGTSPFQSESPRSAQSPRTTFPRLRTTAELPGSGSADPPVLPVPFSDPSSPAEFLPELDR